MCIFFYSAKKDCEHSSFLNVFFFQGEEPSSPPASSSPPPSSSPSPAPTLSLKVLIKDKGASPPYQFKKDMKYGIMRLTSFISIFNTCHNNRKNPPLLSAQR